MIPEIQAGNRTLTNVAGFVVRQEENAVALVHGKTYYVVVDAENNAAGRLHANTSSSGVVVSSQGLVTICYAIHLFRTHLSSYHRVVAIHT